MRGLASVGVAVLLLVVSGPSLTWAAPATFDAAQGRLAASASFETVGSNLMVTLTNTSLYDVLEPSDVLTAVFFNVTAPSLPSLTPVSAIIGMTSQVLFGVTDAGGVVGGEWDYAAGLHNAPHGASAGISSSGLNWFGAANFPGSNLQGPVSVDGLQFGITSAGDDSTTGNQAVTGGNALIKNQVVFILSGVPDGFDPSSRITNVAFQYGTSASEPSITSIPEPAVCLLLASGLIMPRRRNGKW